ncbi:MAG: ATP-binding cassette domain-containing protein [Alphaproteobacteria bacterium]|nr:ATP-binding cassette domain-containing protein [Alphaproteobacteria bacterium]
MSMFAIKVENLSKSYLVGHNAAKRENYIALRDVIAQNAKSLARKTRDMLTGRPIIQGDEIEEFWALKDINFEIKQGDRVGIIGRNGAGKSTLLKILSRITEPTTGRIQINGRVASLLEVGTGFHQELTGRENIFLNGAILGMSRKEIQRKFDEIVEFAEIEKFLDTPVKRYSSGMYVRLAFAVAAHLEPEILVVDEVLAVGDTQFQKKCLGKMDDVAKGGRTVIFVSHNMAAIKSLCDKGLVLSNGEISCYDSINIAVKRYEFLSETLEYAKKFKNKGKEVEQLVGIRLLNQNNEDQGEFQIGDELKIEISLNGLHQDKEYQISYIVQKIDGTNMYHCKSIDDDLIIKKVNGSAKVVSSLVDLRLYPGRYEIVDLWLATMHGTTLDLKVSTVSFEILDGGPMVKRVLQHNAALIHEIPSWKLI